MTYYFDAAFSYLEQIVSKENTILITDENLFKCQQEKFDGWKTIVFKAGEEYKQQATVDRIIEQLIAYEADRKTFIVGIGGGVVTDITGLCSQPVHAGIEIWFYSYYHFSNGGCIYRGKEWSGCGDL